MTLSPEARMLLEAIAGPESAGRYDVVYGGQKFDSFADHPRIAVPIASGPNAGKTSSAAGKYQFLGSTWDDVSRRHGLTDFSPANQDIGAWFLAQEEYARDTGRDLQADLAAGDMSRVAPSLRDQWTSLPGGIEQGQDAGTFTGKMMSESGTSLSSLFVPPTPSPQSSPAAAAPASPATPAAQAPALAGDPGGSLGSLAQLFLQGQQQRMAQQQQAQAETDARRQALLGGPLIA